MAMSREQAAAHVTEEKNQLSWKLKLAAKLPTNLPKRKKAVTVTATAATKTVTAIVVTASQTPAVTPTCRLNSKSHVNRENSGNHVSLVNQGSPNSPAKTPTPHLMNGRKAAADATVAGVVAKTAVDVAAGVVEIRRAAERLRVVENRNL